MNFGRIVLFACLVMLATVPVLADGMSALQKRSYSVGIILGERIYQDFGVLESQDVTDGLDDASNPSRWKLDRAAINTAVERAQKQRANNPSWAPLKGSKESRDLSYSLGVILGERIQNDFGRLLPAHVSKGLTDAQFPDRWLLSRVEINRVVQDAQARAQQEQLVQMQAMADGNLQAGEVYLAENANKNGVIVTASGLQYRVLESGTGASPTLTDTVRVHYEGRLINGEVFDSSIQRGEPVSFPLNGVIPGWSEGVQLMTSGSKYEFTIPAELAYGESGTGPIPPNSVLVFVVELLEIPTLAADTKNRSHEPKVTEIPEITAENRRLRQELEELRHQKQIAVLQDSQNPAIHITTTQSDGARGEVSGIAHDNAGIAEILINGEVVAFDTSGRFNYATFIPSGGIEIKITAYDLKGLSTTETVRLERAKRPQQVSRLAAVNPLVGPRQKTSRDRVAIVIGVEKYARGPAADFAARDAQMFADYAREKLGIAENNIKSLSDTGASKAEILRALKVWLPKVVEPDTTDLYVFYAGHGMPTADGSSAYLVPYDGDIQLLEDTAISRKRFFDEISATKPRSATFFFDNCFSGATRTEELLLASRPLGIKVQETSIPDSYLVFTAGETDQIAGVEPEVKHGRFSYFVFKGLEGEADANRDGKISAGELHEYVRESVGRFSAGAQTPTMLGDKAKWVLR